MCSHFGTSLLQFIKNFLIQSRTATCKIVSNWVPEKKVALWRVSDEIFCTFLFGWIIWLKLWEDFHFLTAKIFIRHPLTWRSPCGFIALAFAIPFGIKSIFITITSSIIERFTFLTFAVIVPFLYVSPTISNFFR